MLTNGKTTKTGYDVQEDVNTDQQKDDTDTETQDDTTDDWTVPPTGTFLRFYDAEPGYLNPHKKDENGNTVTATNTGMADSTNLLVATLGQPAARETSPPGNSTSQVGQQPHPSMEMPDLGKVNEEPTSLLVVPPPGSTNRQPGHSSSSITEDRNPEDETTGSGSVATSWGQHTQTLPAIDLWNAPTPPTRQPTTYIAHTPSAILQWVRSIFFAPSSVMNAKRLLRRTKNLFGMIAKPPQTRAKMMKKSFSFRASQSQERMKAIPKKAGKEKTGKASKRKPHPEFIPLATSTLYLQTTLDCLLGWT
jgi:hypothetical protein